MESVSGVPLFIQQFKSLLKKNVLLSWRNKGATIVHLFASFFFIFLLFSIEKSEESLRKRSTENINVRNPQQLRDFPIPPCEENIFLKSPCFDFIWSGNESSSRIHRIVKAIMDNNPGRKIPSRKVMSFKTRNEAEAWLYTNPMHVPGALHFVDLNATVITYGVQINTTQSLARWHGKLEDPIFKYQIPLQMAAEREITRSILQAPNLNWLVGLTEFAHIVKAPRLPTIALLGSPFFLASAMFGFVLQMSALVTEKELKLRQAMDVNGLYESSYWISWVVWEGIISLITSLLLVLFGMLFQFDTFLKNSFAVVFLVFFLFEVNLIGFGFMLSTFINKASSATTLGFSVFLIGFLTQVFTSFGFPNNIEGIPSSIKFIWTLFPPNLLAIAVKMLSDSSDTPEELGMSWKERSRCPPDLLQCEMTINDVCLRLVYLLILWLALAIYFSNIFPNALGVRKSVFYFLKPGYWTGEGGDKFEEGGICSCIGEIPPPSAVNIPDDDDVIEEEEIVKRDARDGTVNSDVVVQIRGLAKTFPGSSRIGCCKRKNTLPYHAVKGLWVNITQDNLFCLLGPNGAGKTTTINCLTGTASVTSGDALVCGHSVRSTVGMSHIRKIIGVCPQFDILWDALSGEEHLQLFANIKGIPTASIKSVCEEALEKVRLTESATLSSRSYSGGMRRRLSVAIALLGNPKLIILDEPTTGVDPISRKHVWEIIQESKKDRSIVLTTHSMEEAEILSDRIGIMVNGRLRCIGNSVRLKSKFGTGFTLTVSFDEMNGGNTRANHRDIKELFQSCLGVNPENQIKSFMTFVIPFDRKRLLPNFLWDLETRKGEFGILELKFGTATLEDVFLRIAKQAEQESLTVEGEMV